MRVTSIPPSSQRPQIKRMTQQELQGIRYSNEYESASSTNRMNNTRQSQIVPEGRESWQPIYPTTPKEPENNPKDQCLQNRAWFWVFGGVFCLILVIAVVAIVLGIVLPMTTTAAPATNAGRMANVRSVTEPTTICSKTNNKSIGSLKGSTSFEWKSYSYNYVARKTFPIVSFTFQTIQLEKFYFDHVSITETNNDSSVEFLSKTNFDESQSDSNGWTISCQSSCSPVASQIISGSECYNQTGQCLRIQCKANHSSITVIRQGFIAELEKTYTIKFMLNQEPGDSSFYVDIE